MNVYTSVVTFAVFVLVDASPANYYATKYDHLDIEEILNNRRMVYYYANCLLNRGPCPPQGLELKRILPEALETNCLRCTEKQKVVTYRSIKRLRKEYPKTWALLQAQWDPNDIYVKKFEESFKQTPSTAPPENEIIIEDRFGGNVVTKPSPSKQTKPKKTKPAPSTVFLKASTPLTIQTTTTPPINSIASASDVKPSRLPQNGLNVGQQDFGTNVAKQVGLQNPEDESGSNRQLSSTVRPETSSTASTTSGTTSSTSSTTSGTTSSTSSTTSGTSSSTSSTTSGTTSSIFTSAPTTPATLNTHSHIPVGISFDIPISSMNHPQTQELLRNNSSSTSNSPRTTLLPSITTKKIPSTTRQPDPISSLVLSFFNANRPITSRPKTPPTTTTEGPVDSQNLQIRSQKISGHVRRPGIRNRAQLGINTTVQVSVRKPLIQVRLPGLTVNNQVEGFNPVGNLVRGLANAGDRLIETGTSIADNVLTSVRGLFSPRVRRNRALRRRS